MKETPKDGIINLSEIIAGNKEEFKKAEAIAQIQELEKTKRDIIIKAATKVAINKVKSKESLK